MSSDSPLLVDAKATFENTCIDQLSDTTEVDTSIFRMNLGSIVPDWSSAVSSTTPEGDYECVDVNITNSEYRYRVFQKDDEGEDVRIVRCDAKLVIVKDLGTNNSSTFVLFYVPSNDFSRSHSGNIAESVTNFRIPESYSGLKIWTRLDGCLIRVNRYREGFLSDAVSFLNMENEKDLSIRTKAVQIICQNLSFQKGEILLEPVAPCSGTGKPIFDESNMLNPSIIIGFTNKCLRIIWNPDNLGWPYLNNPIPDPGGSFNGGNYSGGGGNGNGNGSGSGNNENYGDLKDDESSTEHRPEHRTVFNFVKNTKYLGYHDQNCFKGAKYIVEQYGCIVADRDDKRNYTFFEEQKINGRTQLVKTGDSEVAISMIMNYINNNKPVLVGVDYAPDLGRNLGTIDHFLVIYGYGYDADNRLFFDYQDTNRSKENYDLTHGPNHKFYYDPVTGLISGKHYGYYGDTNQDYTITHIRYSYSK